MKHIKDILQLGNPLLYQVCEPVQETELSGVVNWASDFHNVIQEIRDKYQFGRAIAAPQLGYFKRVFYTDIDKPKLIINPQFTSLSNEMMEVWDDCMSFPNLLVKVKRHRMVTLEYLDENWNKKTWEAKDDVSELLQHEYDHLDGILCTMRAIDNKSYKWKQ